MHRALKPYILYCSFLSSILLNAAHVDQLPADLYQEIIANADTLADSAIFFSKLSQTSKQMKQRLETALPALVDQLARTYGVDGQLVAWYFGIKHVQQLQSELMNTKRTLTALFTQLLTTESSLSVLQLVGSLLLNNGALPECPQPLEQYFIARQKYSVGLLKKNYLAQRPFDPKPLDSCAFIANSFGGFTALSELNDDDGETSALMLLELQADVLQQPRSVQLFRVGFDVEQWATVLLIEHRDKKGYVLVLNYRSTYRILFLPKERAQKVRFVDIPTRVR